MEGKVLLYDSNNVKIGETYIRRARQLVRQQRALWVDDNQEAIRFTQDENMETATAHENNYVMVDSDSIMQDDDKYVALAVKRINERKKFIIHSIAFIPCWILLFLFTTAILDSMISGALAFFAFISGSWVTSYIIHVYQFAKPRLKIYRVHDMGREERRARKLAMEIASLKAELQRQSM